MSAFVKQKIDWFISGENPYVTATIGTIIVIVLTVAISMALVGTIETVEMEKCLNSDIPRRWHGSICEEYQNGEWIEINPFKSATIYYNEAAEE